MSTESSQRIAYGITYEWLNDGAILRVHIDSHEKSAVDALAEFARQLRDQHAGPYHFLYIVDNPKVALAPYARKRLSDITEAYQDAPGRTAYVLRHRNLNHAMRFFLMARKNQNRPREVFDNEASALTWLQEG